MRRGDRLVIDGHSRRVVSADVTNAAIEWRVNGGLSHFWPAFEAERTRRWSSYWHGILWKWGAK